MKINVNHIDCGNKNNWTLVHLHFGTPALWHTCTLAHLYFGTPVLWYTCTLVHLYRGTLAKHSLNSGNKYFGIVTHIICDPESERDVHVVVQPR
jgi:hypothetical protein